MQKYRKLTANDIETVENILLSLEPETCVLNTANLFCCQNTYSTVFQIHNDFPYFLTENGKTLLVPCGNLRRPSFETLREITDIHKEAGYAVKMFIPEKYLKYYPESTSRLLSENYDEYIYSTSSLAELPGGKLSKKRNLIAQFKKLYPNFEIRQISPEEIKNCIFICRQWIEEKGNSKDLENEFQAITAALNNFAALKLKGVILYANEKPAAFSISSKLNSQTWDEHFEKALREYKGAAQVICQANAENLKDCSKFINREQDLGDPGMRQAKRSYMPYEILKNAVMD